MRHTGKNDSSHKLETFARAIQVVLAASDTLAPLVMVILLRGILERLPKPLPNHPELAATTKQALAWLKENQNFSVPNLLDLICSRKILPKVATRLAKVKSEEVRQILAEILLAEEKSIDHGTDCGCHPAIRQLNEFIEHHVLCLCLS
jgi:hypothetical protein